MARNGTGRCRKEANWPISHKTLNPGIAMAVTISDVRIALNNISTASVADDTVAQKIADGIRIVADMVVDEAAQDPVVRAYAAWQSFIISKDYYESLKAVDLSRKKNAREQAEMLKKNFEEELSIAEGYGTELKYAVKTPMFDDRPTNPDADSETTT